MGRFRMGSSIRRLGALPGAVPSSEWKELQLCSGTYQAAAASRAHDGDTI